jgi:hypothetical protein
MSGYIPGMPLVAFSEIPDSARVWVFASSSPLSGDAEATLLRQVDDFLDGWRAHGEPLSAARDWRDHQFLAVTVDPRDAAASGCSLDALFRIFRTLEREAGTTMLGGSRVFFRDASGAVVTTDRPGFDALASTGAVTADTPVFDPSVTTAGDWRTRFETTAGRSWHADLLPASR